MKTFSPLTFLSAIFVFNVNAGKIRESFSLVPLQFRYHGITPAYVDPAPRELCQVEWPSGVAANLGNSLTATETTDKPDVTWDCDKRAKYSVFFFDLDVLGMDNRLVDEGRLWFVANITDCNVHNGETVVDLLPTTPLYGSGEHRFVILVYKQAKGVYYEEPFVTSTEVEHRFYTTMQKFAVKYNLGRAVCGNFFLCEWDPRVDQTFAGLDQPFPAYITRAIAQADLPPH